MNTAPGDAPLSPRFLSVAVIPPPRPVPSARWRTCCTTGWADCAGRPMRVRSCTTRARTRRRSAKSAPLYARAQQRTAQRTARVLLRRRRLCTRWPIIRWPPPRRPLGSTFLSARRRGSRLRSANRSRRPRRMHLETLSQCMSFIRGCQMRRAGKRSLNPVGCLHGAHGTREEPPRALSHREARQKAPAPHHSQKRRSTERALSGATPPTACLD